MQSPRDRLIVALDSSVEAAAEAMVARLGDAVSFYKIGYQLAFAGGLPFAQALAGAGKRVFLDMKLTTSATRSRAASRASRGWARVPHRSRLSADHAGGGRGAQSGSELQLLAVTVLTSYDDGDLAEAGYRSASSSWPSAPRRRDRSASTAWCARRRRPRRCAPPSVRTCCWSRPASGRKGAAWMTRNGRSPPARHCGRGRLSRGRPTDLAGERS